MLKRMMLAWVMVLASAVGTFAQEDPVWIQIEAQPNLNAATDRARIYAAELPDVNGFSLGGGWYGIALGPYARSDAEQVLRVYRSEGVIPRDSYIALSSAFRQQFWPVGANVLNRGVVDAPLPATPAAPEPTVEAPAPEPADETPAQAQRSERQLTRAQREDLQVALQWAGTYRGGIDGAFGRGTRNAMAAWQERKGFDVTGILTTQQRAVLLQDYNSVLDGLGLEVVRDDTAGIEMLMPTEVVAFDKYEYPFAHYSASGDIEATVLLISQQGDQTTLFGLYDIMQTLDIVPLDGPRERKDRSFTLVGQDATRVSETRVALEDGQIKGFTVVWPAGDEERRTRLMDEMEKSFSRTEGTIPASASTSEQAIDLVSGLEIRKPRLSRSGFFVDRRGTVLTTAEAVNSCTRVTIDSDVEAEVSVLDDARGVAVLKPETTLAPRAVARFAEVQPRLQSEVAAAGFSFEGVLGAPSMTFGTLSDVRGLNGEPDLARLAVNTLPGDAGGPVLDAGGGVLGMLLPDAQTGRALPDGVRFALDREALQDVLAQAGMAAAGTNSAAPIDPVDLSEAATGMTVLVSCWD
ncbi:trypsin-like peptidase domain-containing protein [Tateyamaria omphalii]|uniref:serine protease n=1 Tax=Tateyamaria omphalii TaxID=299262 RepID=UPI001C997606|nr:serine protease [Tateyamaria omphalii]MBY5933047.1 trypsin-like peptidase domain-containing protein [Tateyamaria omphalii]